MKTSKTRETVLKTFADLEPRPEVVKVIEKPSLSNSASQGRYISDEGAR